MSSSSSNHQFLEYPQTKPPLLIIGSKTLKWRPNSAIEVAPSCPRCFSSNTKFCYYNNYSVSQPRYFCKACRRYWTKGGSLRNVPIGGGCRKTRRTTRAAARSDPSTPPPVADANAAPPEHVVKDNYESSNFAPSAAMFECGGIDGGDEQLGQLHESFENFGVFEVEGIGLGSEVFPNLEGFGCGQPPLTEMQEFHEVFSSGDDDHQLRMSYENLMTDNWGSFDLSAYDNF